MVISTANGLKFPDFKIRYHKGELDEVNPHNVNAPVELEPDYDQVMKAIDSHLTNDQGSE